MSQSLKDVAGLSLRPTPPDAVRWAEDGTLAVSTEHAVVLLSPGDLEGPRAFATPGALPEPAALQAPGAPARPVKDAHHELAHLRVAAMVSQYPALQAGLTVRSLDWSPAGAAQNAGCLLATVSSDHQVCDERWMGSSAAADGRCLQHLASAAAARRAAAAGAACSTCPLVVSIRLPPGGLPPPPKKITPCLCFASLPRPQVLVFGPPAGPTSEWQVVADLSVQLVEHLEATDWRDLDPEGGAEQQQQQQQQGSVADADANDEGVLRLRGGGKRRQPAKKQAAGGAAAAAAGAGAAEDGPVCSPEAAFEPTVGQAVEVCCG